VLVSATLTSCLLYGVTVVGYRRVCYEPAVSTPEIFFVLYSI
jgi:hypothetical protein